MRRGLQIFLGGLGALSVAERRRASALAADSWANELAAGEGKDPAAAVTPMRVAGRAPELVVVEEIDVVSVCPHHLLPMRGRASLAYAPEASLAPLGHLAALARSAAARLILQEELSELVVDALMRALAPRGAACLVEGSHDCLQLRGPRAAAARVSVLAVRGSLSEPDARAILLRRPGGTARPRRSRP